MAARGAPSTRLGSAVLLHESEHTRISRVMFRDGTAIRKEPLGPDARTRLRHERAILKRLAGAYGVIQLAPRPTEPGALLLVDIGGTPLTGKTTPLAVAELLPLARNLARAVAEIHRRQVIHRDINPANIVVVGHDPYLIDFTLATTFAELRPAFTHHNEIVGTLPYLAPEVTGRTGRPVDQRADLYALGATLYELATGDPPFGTGDPLRLTHDHLARIPVSPRSRNPSLPDGVSDIILRLLEKEPDNRYQTAEGLLHDLERVTGAQDFIVGERDFPVRLRAPSQLIGRDAEIAVLGDAFTAALTGDCRGVLVDGPPGVGKTALVNELRPIVTAGAGWFVSGKFDHSRRDLHADGVLQAFRELGRLLLAEPESELVKLRERLRETIGADLEWVAAVLPEFATLLRVEPATPAHDPVADLARSQRALTNVLRAVASPRRPVVMFVDDLQWAGRGPLKFIERIFEVEVSLTGVLLVGAYRSDGLDPDHPLTTLAARWQSEAAGPKRVTLSNLSPAELATMLADVLRVPPQPARELAAAIAPRTRGNPYDTLELLNALRREDLLVPTERGWRWDTEVIRRHLGTQPDLRDLLASRAAALPERTRTLVEHMACLGGRVDLPTLAVAAGQPVEAVERRLAAALSDGLLVMEPGARDTVRFRHDLTSEAIVEGMTPDRELTVRLQLARRLAAHPDLFAAAAEQYLPVMGAVTESEERIAVSGLLRRAAEQARMLGNFALAERLLTAALPLLDPADPAAPIEVHTGRHAALYSLGRLEEANEVYQLIESLTRDPLARMPATLTQISSLTNQNRPQEAISLGLRVLGQLGVTVPDRMGLAKAAERGLAVVDQWLTTPEGHDLRRSEPLAPTPAAVASLIDRTLPPAFFSDPQTFAWLAVTAMEMWVRYGPARPLVGPVSHVPYVLSADRQDRRAGREVLRRVQAVSAAHGWEPETSQARFLYALGVGHWFEPIEEVVPQAHRARTDLLRGGDQQNSSYTYYATVPQLLDYAPILQGVQAEVDAALADATRTGNAQAAEAYRAYQRLVDLLRGARRSPTPEPEIDAHTPTAGAYIRITRALAAALLDQQAELDRQSQAAMALLPAIEATYATQTAHLLRGLAVADRARTGSPDQRRAALHELDTIIDWFAARSADASENLCHLQRLLEAERAWAMGQFQSAVTAFDAAIHDAGQRRRPWHRGLTLERAGKFYSAHGIRYTAQVLLSEARQTYQAWGATAKVDQLNWVYPGLSAAPTHYVGHASDLPSRRARLTTGAIDLMAILDASRALSSETELEGLQARVTKVLSAMTGATRVELLLSGDDGQGWQLASGDSRTLTPVTEDDPEPPVPMSAVRYVQRTGEPLVVHDATRDDRFARDPYFSGMERCSLLVAPIRNQGKLQALLVVENRLIRAAFPNDRLDAVKLIAGQLAVSLDNARLYSSLEQRVAERTEELAVANRRLELLSVTDALTGLANRRRLEEVLDAHWRRTYRTGRPLALALVDIDHFKLYNDYYGHAAGDRALQRIATVLRETIRETDLVARFGGEEFAVVMPDTDLAAANQVARRLHAAVMRLAVPHQLVSERIVTVSIGVAALVPDSETNLNMLFELADVELYRAKRGGRNQVRVAPP